MKWLLCVIFLAAGLLSGALVNRWLRGSAAAPLSGSSLSAVSPPAIHGNPTGSSSTSSTQAAWDQLMDRARTESLPDLAALQRRQAGGPLNYLAWIERDLALWQAIDRGGDVAAICALLTAFRSSASGTPPASDWAPHNLHLGKFLFWQLGRRDPQGTLKALGEGYLETLGPVFTAWAEKDPQAALKAADENYQGLNRAYAIVTVLSSLAGQDPAEAIRLAADLKREGEDPVQGILYQLGKNHPRQALNFLLEPGNTLSREQTSELVRRSVTRLAQEPGGSPWEPLSELAEAHDPAIVNAAAGSLGEQAALIVPFPNEALAILERLPLEAQEKAMSSGLAVALYRSDPALADRMLDGLPSAAAAQVIGKAAEAALQGGSLDFPPDPVLSQDIASRLSYQKQLDLMDHWEVDWTLSPANGEAWLAKVDDPFWRDQFAEKFAGRLTHYDPAGAARLASSIADETRREAVLTPILQKWQAEFPGAAKAWQAERDKQVPATGSLPAAAQ